MRERELSGRPTGTAVPEDVEKSSRPSGGRWDELPSGSFFAGKYRIERLIARGGMSGVYLATQIPLGRPVALKILVPLVEDAEGEASFEERFRLEARTLATLNHPNIVVLYDYGETEDGRFFLAMEYVDGPRLSDVLKEAGRLPLQRALRLTLLTCAALRYAHNRGVVHRDIKLSNVMLYRDQDGAEQVKVVDFGLVKLTEADQRLTSAGMVLGSPHFIAPEQARGQPVDHRADIYAVGITLFCMLTGKPPFSGATATATILAHLTQPIPTVESVAPDLDLPAGVEAVLQRCLAKRAEERYPDMSHLIADLSALSDGSLPGTLRADVPSSSTMIQVPTGALAAVNPDSRKKLVIGAVIGGFALLLLGGGLAFGVVGLLKLSEEPAAAPASSAPATTATAEEPAAPAAPAAAEPTPAAAGEAAPAEEPAVAAPVEAAAPVQAAKPSKASAPADAGARAKKPVEAAAAPAAAPAPKAEPSAAPASTPKAEPAPSGDPAGWKQSDLKNPWDD